MSFRLRAAAKTGFNRQMAGGIALAVAVLIAFTVVLTRDFGGLVGQSASASQDRPVLLILPFENLGNAEDAFLATGVSDEINGRLSALSSLAVISRRSAAGYAETDKSIAEIGDELGVDYILEGKVRWARQADGGSRVRISPMLIRVSDDTQLWADSYDRGIDDIFATSNVAAYEAYLRGSALFWKDDFDGAAAALEDAIALDPNFVQAAYLLSRNYSFHYWSPAKRDELEPLVREAVDRVISMAPGSP